MTIMAMIRVIKFWKLPQSVYNNLFAKHDYLARLGGDEFLLGFKTSKESSSFLKDLNKNIKTIISAPIAFQGHILNVGVSVGYANYPSDGKTIEELIKVADESMYRDKQKSKVNLQSIASPVIA